MTLIGCRMFAVGVALLLAVAGASCTDQQGEPTPEVSPTPTAASLGVHAPEDLEEAGREVVSFLRGRTELASLENVRLGETVTLALSPAAGGDRTQLEREDLADLGNWMVHSESVGNDYKLTPPDGEADLQVAVGRHRNCFEYELSSVAEDLAEAPHVGTTLRYGDTCLLTWNLTLVFDPELTPPTLIAAVYDQWEW